MLALHAQAYQNYASILHMSLLTSCYKDSAIPSNCMAQSFLTCRFLWLSTRNGHNNRYSYSILLEL